MNGSIFEEVVPVSNQEMVIEVDSLMAHLEQLIDPRTARGIRYGLVHLLTLLVLAKLGGEDTIHGMAEWVKVRGAELVSLLKLPRESLPHATTYERVLGKLDVAAFEQAVGAFFAKRAVPGGHISLDGKTLRGTIPDGETQGLHLLAAYSVEHGVTLMQVEVAASDNEISTAPRLLEALDLRDQVVTADAMLTQRELCAQIVAAGGAYVLPVKANQGLLQQAIAESFLPPPPSHGYRQSPLSTISAQSLNSGHGRLEYRWLDAHTHLNDYLDWPHLAQVFRLQRVVHYQKTGKLTYQVVFGIASLENQQATPEQLLHFVRQHWHIENRLHYVRDVSFHEDDCKVRFPPRQRFLAALNNLAIGLIRLCDFDFVPQARRYFAVHYNDALQLLG